MANTPGAVARYGSKTVDAASRHAGRVPTSREAVLKTLDVSVPQVETPTAYGWAMTAVVAFLVLIPLMYLALIAFLGWLFAWHVYQGFASMQYGPYFLFHFPMALLGGLLVLFLIKPVFLRRKDEEGAILTLKRDEEPMLFAFVEKLCAATGAPCPTRIEVDCEANAGARILKGVIAGNRHLVLRLGLPLAASMPVQQFAGVLAHEFGHFNQKTGMTGSYLIRQLINFFAKIVFQRDRLDEKLQRMRHSRNGLGRAIFWSAGWLIEAARGVLWAMLVLGELLACGILRRMEYDADRVEAHIAGVKDFVRTSQLMLFLNIAARRARYDLADAWEQRRLANDLPRLIVEHAKQLAEHRDDILKLLEKEKTSVFDTHPCHNDRVASVKATGAEGLVSCAVASKHLFANFDDLCQRASIAFYRTVIGEGIDKAKLVPVKELVEQRKGERESFKALRRFFRNGTCATRPLLPLTDALEPLKDGEADEVAQQLAAARDEMMRHAAEASPAADQYEKSNALIVIAKAKMSLSHIFHSGAADKLRISSQLDLKMNEPARMRAAHTLIPFEKAARERLTAAMRLAMAEPYCQIWEAPAEDAQTARTEPRPPGPRATGQLIGVLQLLEPWLGAIEEVRELALNIRVYMSAYDEQHPYGPLVDRVIQRGREVVKILNRFTYDLAEIPYPFAHAKENCSLAAALIEETPDPKDPAAVHGVALSLVDRFYDLLYRALAELTGRAERIERAIGLPALPDPPEKKDDSAEKEELKEEKRNTRRYWVGYGLRAAGGFAMLFLLVAWSISPPSLPAMGWPKGDSSGRSYQYRPASFSVSHNYSPDNYPRYSPYSNNPNVYNPNPYNPNPNRYGQPYQPPGYQPPNPQPYQPNQPYQPQRRNGYQGYQPGNPQPYNPQPYRPSPGGGGGPSPGGPSSPGGGGGGRR